MATKSMLVLGLMSGTSADGIDVALARISGAPPHLHAKLLGHTSSKFSSPLRKEILRVAEQQPITAGELSQLNFRLGEVFAEAALAACRKFRISPKRIALIGSHGQTIFHQGAPAPYLGRPTASTLQIGEPSVIAARTGITTDGDFRPADIALGGKAGTNLRLRHRPRQHAYRRARRPLQPGPPEFRQRRSHGPDRPLDSRASRRTDARPVSKARSS